MDDSLAIRRWRPDWDGLAAGVPLYILLGVASQYFFCF